MGWVGWCGGGCGCCCVVFVGGRWRAGVTSGWRQAMVSMCQWEELQRELEVVCGVVEVEIGEMSGGGAEVCGDPAGAGLVCM